MTFTAQEIKKLAMPGLIFLALIVAGAAVILQTNKALIAARQQLVAAQQERTQNRERLSRIAEEEREVNQKIRVYRQLRALNIIGPERRLDWTDSIARIRVAREILDVRYRVERQGMFSSLPGNPGSVDFFASAMKVELALLHELDLLRFLGDLRDSGNAYYAVRRCTMNRTGQPAAAASLAPRLAAECEIDLITILDRGAKA